MMVLGMDADTKRLAWASLEHGETAYTAEICRQIGQGPARRFADDYVARLTALMRRLQKVGAIIYLEDIFMSSASSDEGERRSMLSYAALARVQGEVCYEAHRHAVPIRIIGANEWRKGVFGVVEGREACKRAARLKALELLGTGERSEHQDEAFCIALYGLQRETGRLWAAKQGESA